MESSAAPDTLAIAAQFRFATWAGGAVPIAFVLHILLLRSVDNGSARLGLVFAVFLAAATFLWLGVVSEIVPDPYLVSFVL